MSINLDIVDVTKKVQVLVNEAEYINIATKRKCDGSYLVDRELRHCENIAIFVLGFQGECDMDHKHKVKKHWLCLLHEYERQIGTDRASPLLDIMEGKRSIEEPYSPSSEDELRMALFEEPKSEVEAATQSFEFEQPEHELDDHAAFFNSAPSALRETFAECAPGGVVPFVQDLRNPGFCSCGWKMIDNPLDGKDHDVRHTHWHLEQKRLARVREGPKAFVGDPIPEPASFADFPDEVDAPSPEDGVDEPGNSELTGGSSEQIDPDSELFDDPQPEPPAKTVKKPRAKPAAKPKTPPATKEAASTPKRATKPVKPKAAKPRTALEVQVERIATVEKAAAKKTARKPKAK